MFMYRLCHNRGEVDWIVVSELAHRLAPGAMQAVVIGGCLQSCGFAHSEVADGAIHVAEYVLPAGDTVNTGLQCFGRCVDV